MNLDSKGFTWIHLYSLAFTWSHLDSRCTHLDSPALARTHLHSLGILLIVYSCDSHFLTMLSILELSVAWVLFGTLSKPIHRQANSITQLLNPIQLEQHNTKKDTPSLTFNYNLFLTSKPAGCICRKRAKLERLEDLELRTYIHTLRSLVAP